MPKRWAGASKPAGVVVGRDLDTGQRVLLTEAARATHLQVIGSTGTGKSKFLEWMIREDILARRGLCLIDPHGRLYRDVLVWLARNDRDLKRPVILFNPADDEYTTGFNPLRRSAKDLAHQVDEMVRACAKVWGADGLDATPLLKKCLRMIFTVLAERQLTLLEAQHLINPEARELRAFLTAPLASTLLGDQWAHYNRSANPRQFAEDFGSSINRLVEFLTAPRLRRILGQTAHALDLRQIMDQGAILLVNLSTGGRVSRDNARLLGTLLVNDLFLTATERPKGARPFYAYIDECQYYLNEDIGHILDEGRKFGLHLTLAHQHLAQLKEAGEAVYKSVLTDAKTKVIFGGLDPEDARVLAELVYMGEFDPDEIKLELRRTFEHHRLEWLTIHSRHRARTTGSGHSSGTSATSSSGAGSGQQWLPSEALFGSPVAGASFESSFQSDGRGSFEADSWMSADTEGESESTVPFLIPEEDQEVSSVQFRNLDEQLYRAMATMIRQPTQQALFKVLTAKTRTMHSPDVSEPYVRPERLRRYEVRRYTAVPFTLPSAEADATLETRTATLLAEARTYFDGGATGAVHSPAHDDQPQSIPLTSGKRAAQAARPDGAQRQAPPVSPQPRRPRPPRAGSGDPPSR